MRPLMTTRPMASGQVTWPTTETARNELMPRPAAKAKGRRVTRPNSTVMTPGGQRRDGGDLRERQTVARDIRAAATG